MKSWLLAHWVAGALITGLALLALVPLAVTVLPLGLTGLLLIYLHSPGYMLHQVEEHWGDRFRSFVNARMFAGVEALTPLAVLWINLPGVWGLNLAALYAAAYLGLGWGLAAPYLMLVNAVAHIATAMRVRGYNPGLATALVIFVPLGLTTILLIPATVRQHAVGFGVAMAVHIAIAAHTGLRATRLKHAAATPA